MEKLIIHSELTDLLLESAYLLITFICLTGLAPERGLTRCEELLSP